MKATWRRVNFELTTDPPPTTTHDLHDLELTAASGSVLKNQSAQFKPTCVAQEEKETTKPLTMTN